MELDHRPKYHFQPLANWMNDPNGLIQWKGTYHLFYQHNPHEAVHGQIHWGHAMSEDLVHWVHLPIALAPDPWGPDKDGCYSGCAVNDCGTPTLVYTGVHPQVQCLATSEDGLISWQKDPGNPIIATPPEGLSLVGFRDPYVWCEDGEWLMALGAGREGRAGMVLLYRSSDLRQWEYLHPLCEANSLHEGVMWECPNFVSVEGRHVLFVSALPLRRVLYFVGEYAERRFSLGRANVLDYGGHFYAPQVLVDEQGRRLLWGWIWEGRSQAAQRAAGWAGVMSLPRELSWDEQGRLCILPVRELQALRRGHWRLGEIAFNEGSYPLEVQ
ncbi:MAG: glycoside hydrolase family 32 protein, partial [Anaerolineae bacterium]|nr:glycoside hydrolase family 32 protein [Anaerolineae bacterium]